jgi:hypothetical protein
MQTKFTLSFFLVLFFLVNIVSIDDTTAQIASAANNKPTEPEYVKKAKEKVATLETYLQRIASKTTAITDKNKTIELAIDLFKDETATVEVTKSQQRQAPKPIRKYLNTLAALPYAKVVIDWYDVAYISDLRLAPNGKYYGVITFYQKFTGYDKEGRVVIGDTVKKSIEVEMTKKIQYRNGQKHSSWEVLLSDIAVAQN